MSGVRVVNDRNNEYYIIPDASRRTYVALPNDQSAIKGILWGWGAFKCGMATLGGIGFTLFTSPLIVTPMAAVPIVSGVTTYIFASLTNTCANNSLYHLGSRNVVVIESR